MTFFFIESANTFVNLANVCDIRPKDDCVEMWFANKDIVKYTLTDEERAKLLRFLRQNAIA